jgi:ABC-type uncharacterized transport system permease subunit
VTGSLSIAASIATSTAASIATGDVSPLVLGVADGALDLAPSPAMWAAVVLYVGATIAFVLGATGRVRAARVARILIALGFVAHAVDIGWRGVLDVHPATSVREALGFLAWIIAGGYLAAALRWRLDLAGVAAVPVVLVVLLAARLTPAGEVQEGLSTLGRVHITLATVGVAVFALASALSAVYLLEERNLKKKRFDTLTFKSGGAPLDKLDGLSHRLVWIGFPIYTSAVILGALWMSQRGENLLRLEYLLAVFSWLVYAGLLVMRTVHGWRGRRAARLTLIGFALAVLVLAIYLVRRIWGG